MFRFHSLLELYLGMSVDKHLVFVPVEKLTKYGLNLVSLDGFSSVAINRCLLKPTVLVETSFPLHE